MTYKQVEGCMWCEKHKICFISQCDACANEVFNITGLDFDSEEKLISSHNKFKQKLKEKARTHWKPLYIKEVGRCIRDRH